MSQVLFRELIEDESLRDRLSDHSEELLWRDKESIWSCCWENYVVKYQKVNANHKEQASQVLLFSVFAKMQESGVFGNFS